MAKKLTALLAFFSGKQDSRLFACLLGQFADYLTNIQHLLNGLLGAA